MGLCKIYSRLMNEVPSIVPLCVGLAAGALLGYKYAYYQMDDADDDEADCEDPGASTVRYDDDVEYKMVLCVRNDLKMGKGKIGAQCR